MINSKPLLTGEINGPFLFTNFYSSSRILFISFSANATLYRVDVSNVNNWNVQALHLKSSFNRDTEGGQLSVAFNPSANMAYAVSTYASNVVVIDLTTFAVTSNSFNYSTTVGTETMLALYTSSNTLWIVPNNCRVELNYVYQVDVSTR